LFPEVPFYLRTYVAIKCKGDKTHPFETVAAANRDRLQRLIPKTPNDSTSIQTDSLSETDTARYRKFWDKCYAEWNNPTSDALALCAHIECALDGIFVTRDTNFIIKIDRLRERVPMLRILAPADAVTEIKKWAESDSAL
jgi:hypothetical protein